MTNTQRKSLSRLTGILAEDLTRRFPEVEAVLIGARSNPAIRVTAAVPITKEQAGQYAQFLRMDIRAEGRQAVMTHRMSPVRLIVKVEKVSAEVAI